MKKYLSIVLVLILCILLTGCGNSENNKTYNQALDYLNNNQYENAISEFNKIIDYKDSKNKIKETYYLYAKSEIGQEYYDSAIKLLSECKNYKDSDELLKEATYQYSKKLLNSNSKEAISNLETIKDYKDVNDILEDYKKNHIFDGTYSDKDESKLSFERRYIVNGLPTTIISYQYNYTEKVIGDNKYSKGYFNRYENKLECNDDYTICTSSDDNYDRTYSLYDDKIIVKVHNKKPSNWEKNYTEWEDTYYKISDSIEMPQERK